MENSISVLNIYGTLISDLSRISNNPDRSISKEILSTLERLRDLLDKVLGPRAEVSATKVERAPEVRSAVRALVPLERLTEFAEENPKQLLKILDETRLRMIAVLLGGGAVVESGVDTLTLDFASNGPLITDKSGLTYGFIGSSCVVLMPVISNLDEARAVTVDMLNVFDAAVDQGDWIIDCSAIKHFSTPLLATLLGYAESLAMQQRQLKLVWLSLSALPAESVARVCTVFNLKQIGTYLFHARSGLEKLHVK